MSFLQRTTIFNDMQFQYVIYLPLNFSPEQRYPFILFLHGAGERGNDNIKPAQVGLIPAAQQNPTFYPAIITIPQIPNGMDWGPKDGLKIAMSALEETLTEFKTQIELDRLYLTGLSMGGYGTFTLASLFPKKFAAIAPICAPYTCNERTNKILSIPMWVFHGANDDIVDVIYSRDIVDFLKKSGANEVKYTEYEGVDHKSWERAYREKDFVDWLFSKKLLNNS